MKEIPSIMIRKYANSAIKGFLIIRDEDTPFALTRKEQLKEAFDRCFWIGDYAHAGRGGKISNPIRDKYYETFIENKFCVMPQATFTLKEVEIPLFDGKIEGFYYDNNKLMDMYGPYRSEIVTEVR